MRVRDVGHRGGLEFAAEGENGLNPPLRRSRPPPPPAGGGGGGAVL